MMGGRRDPKQAQKPSTPTHTQAAPSTTTRDRGVRQAYNFVTSTSCTRCSFWLYVLLFLLLVEILNDLFDGFISIVFKSSLVNTDCSILNHPQLGAQFVFAHS